MISAGNDIISLSAIDITRTNQQKFYSKILSPEEKEIYNQPGFTSVPFENFVWLLWSIKEAAYKYLKRHNPGVAFIPVKFVVTELHVPNDYSLTSFGGKQTEGTGFVNMPVFKGIIKVGDDTIYSNSLIYRELIFSTVNGDDDFENINWGIKIIDRVDAEYQSAVVRAFLIDRLQRFFNVDGIVIDKNTGGIPFVLKGGAEFGVVVSLSHHEEFVGYSFRSQS
jgi:phosphopantetheinyl transferase (holo-ACP synthase)